MLEKKIEKLTATIKKLIEALSTNPPTTPALAVVPKAAAVEKSGEIKSVDIEDVRAALFELSKSKGRDAAKNLLADFSARKVGEIKPADYLKVIEIATKYREAA